jgi:metallopeptidase family M12-like protein
MVPMVYRRFLAVSALFLASFAFSASASSARVFNPALRRALGQMPANGKATLHDIALGRESLDTIELEPMEVWAKDAKIIVYGEGGKETIIAPPAVKYFKGQVVGDDDSVVFFSMSADGTIRGMVLLGDKRFTLGTGVRKPGRVRTDATMDDREAPVLISEMDDIDEINDPGSDWACAVGKDAPNTIPHLRELSELRVRSEGKAIPNAGIVSGATYQLRLAIETDNEFCTAFGNNDTTITTYIGDLVGKASIVYSRDLKTTLVIGETHLRSAGADPWTVTTGSGTGAALAEFGLYWHNNYSLGYPAVNGGTPGGGTAVARSSAVFLSGKGFNGGIAWIDQLCATDFYCGAGGASCGSATYAGSYAGGYAFNGSLSSGVTTTVPDPEATVNGVQYGLPTSSNFWMLLEMLHELGHNVASPHSNCVALSPAEQAAYGVARAWVDLCLTGDSFNGNACYSGTTSAPAEKGSIMSYCHNIFYTGSFRASRYLFGKTGEPSEKMLPIFKLGADLDTGSPSGLEGCTPNPTITAQAEPVACSAGRTASVATCTGCTYAWQITGGSITSSTTASSITYTPSQTNVTLTVTIITPRGCGITASKSILTSCVAVSPPTGVTATATSTSNVDVTWSLAVGATSYNIYRSTNGSTYTLAGSSVTPPFSDGGRTANTAYLYKVRSVNGGESADSNRDLATTVIFTDDPLVAGTTTIQAVHLTQLRTAVDAVRTLATLSAGSYTDPTITPGTTTIKAAHITDLRTALDAARSGLTLSAVSYGESIVANTTTIKASHLTELRNGVK